MRLVAALLVVVVGADRRRPPRRKPRVPPKIKLFPLAPSPLPNTTIVRAARELAAQNRAKLEALRERLRGGDEEKLCSGPFPARKETPVLWFHCPKCGSTFFNTVFRYACMGDRDDIYLGGPRPRDMAKSMNKSVMDVKNIAELIDHGFCDNSGRHRFLVLPNYKASQVVQQWATHKPLRKPANDQFVVALMREPHQRVLSAYHFNKHVWGGEMRGNGIAASSFVEWRNFIHSDKISNARDFAALPGIGACMTKMIGGCYCATRPSPNHNEDGAPYTAPLVVACPYRWAKIDQQFADMSAQRVSKFGFVGLQDVYNASVCLFHRMYGLAPMKHEFSLYNVGWKHGGSTRGPRETSESETKYKLANPGAVAPSTWDAALLGDFVDVVDHTVYAAALRRFEADLDTYLVSS